MRTPIRILATAATALVAPAAVAVASTSHAGWPDVAQANLVMNKANANTTLTAPSPGEHNELLGGHGDDTLVAGRVGDILWGDFNPGGQPESQVDHITGGAGKDFIYASHGTNYISGGGGADQIHAHYGHGSITCASDKATVFLSHRSLKRYTLHGCTKISFKTVGY